MPNSSNVRMSDVTSIKATYDRRGNLVERIMSRDILVPQGSERQKKIAALDMLTKEVADLHISPEFGNMLAKIVKNPKRKSKKHKRYIEFGAAEMKFKRSAQTDLNSIKLIAELEVNRDKYGTNEPNQRTKLHALFKEKTWLFWLEHPLQAITIEALRKRYERSEQALRRWYERVNEIESNEASKIPFENIKKFYDDKVASVTKEQPWVLFYTSVVFPII